MTRVVVNPGVCGMTATVEVIRVDKRRVRVKITSDCEMVTEMGKPLAELDQEDALKSLLHSKVYQYAAGCSLHTTCPVPMAILKAIEVEAGLALPRPVLVQFEAPERG